METKPAVRCHHVSTSGLQCGSPALVRQRLCYYHQQGRSTAFQYYSEAPFCAFEEDLPLFEDSHSIQIAIRQIVSRLLQRKIDPKTAGLLLYSIQLALLNLKQLKAEKPLPAAVVVDIDKLEETLPESAFTQTAPPEAASEPPRKQPKSADHRKDEGQPTEEETQEMLDYADFLGKHLNAPAGSIPDEETFIRLRRAQRAQNQAESEVPIPPSTIQACAVQSQRSRRRQLN